MNLMPKNTSCTVPTRGGFCGRDREQSGGLLFLKLFTAYSLVSCAVTCSIKNLCWPQEDRRELSSRPLWPTSCQSIQTLQNLTQAQNMEKHKHPTGHLFLSVWCMAKIDLCWHGSGSVNQLQRWISGMRLLFWYHAGKTAAVSQKSVVFRPWGRMSYKFKDEKSSWLALLDMNKAKVLCHCFHCLKWSVSQ